jgi:DNA-binding MarR family transcriptional regulator
MYWDDLGFLKANKLSRKIIRFLESIKGPVTPLEISKATDIARSNVSTQLIELRKRNLVVCLNPKARKGRLYTVTDKGRKILKNIK